MLALTACGQKNSEAPAATEAPTEAQDFQATVITKEEADALRKAEEERRAKIKSFPLEVTYMHDSGFNREMGIAPELRTVTFENFASGEESSTDLCYTIMNEQNPAFEKLAILRGEFLILLN